jgi:hypothetical protein
MIDVALHYCSERDLSADYRQALTRVARSMQASGITPLTLEDSVCNRWLLGAAPSQSTTRSNYRRMGLTLWRAALDLQLATHRIGRVARVKCRVAPPVAWSASELSRLLSHAEQMTGVFRASGCPQSLFWRGWILTGYETGVRFRDLHYLQANQMRDCRLWVVQHKTGRPLGKQLSANCQSVLCDLAKLSTDGSLFRWALSRKHVFLHFRKLVKDAGLAGSSKFLRRSGATAVEMASPGAASKFLGHLSPGLAAKHYLDPTLLAERQPSPPPICVTQSKTAGPSVASS